MSNWLTQATKQHYHPHPRTPDEEAFHAWLLEHGVSVRTANALSRMRAWDWWRVPYSHAGVARATDDELRGAWLIGARALAELRRAIPYAPGAPVTADHYDWWLSTLREAG